MVGPFKKASGGYTHLLVAVDKFTKWIEAKPIRKVDGASATKFVWDIISRFGVPHSIITDNGSNLSQGELADYLGSLVKVHFISLSVLVFVNNKISRLMCAKVLQVQI